MSLEPRCRRPSLAEAKAYCRRLAVSHYENFSVASWLLPRRLRCHFYHIYAYCRWADDLADETGDPARSLLLIDWWEEQLDACYRGRSQHPVFVALESTISEFDIPDVPFRDLLVAFRRDQGNRRFKSIEELLTYCTYSANPVGQLVLYLGGCHDDRRVGFSNSICTGLQLANLWQDLARDVDRGRIYLPTTVCHEHGYDESMLKQREYNRAFRQMMSAEVNRAEEFLRAGRPLVELVSPALRFDVALFIAGGREVLKGIRRLEFNVWRTRPVVSRAVKLRLLLSSWWHLRRSGLEKGVP